MKKNLLADWLKDRSDATPVAEVQQGESMLRPLQKVQELMLSSYHLIPFRATLVISPAAGCKACTVVAGPVGI